MGREICLNKEEDDDDDDHFFQLLPKRSQSRILISVRKKEEFFDIFAFLSQI